MMKTPQVFRPRKDLFDRFWNYKLKVIHRRVDPSRVEGVVDRIVKQYDGPPGAFQCRQDCSTNTRMPYPLWSPRTCLVKDGQRVSFFHESFFDYIFARRMVSDPDFDLVSYILEQGQSLFIRSQVRQVLL